MPTFEAGSGGGRDKIYSETKRTVQNDIQIKMTKNKSFPLFAPSKHIYTNALKCTYYVCNLSLIACLHSPHPSVLIHLLPLSYTQGLSTLQ